MTKVKLSLPIIQYTTHSKICQVFFKGLCIHIVLFNNLTIPGDQTGNHSRKDERQDIPPGCPAHQ